MSLSPNSLQFASSADELKLAKSRFIATAVVFPIVVAAISIALMLVWIPSLPDPAATHWGFSGAPDGFGAAWTFPAGVAGLTVLFTGLSAAIALTSASNGQWGASPRAMGAFMPATLIFIIVMLTVAVAAQRGLANAHDGPGIFFPMLVAAVSAAVVGVACWLVQPNVTVQTERPEPVAAAELAATTRVVWVRSVRTAPAGLIAICLGILSVGVAAVVMFVGGELIGGWIALGVTVVLATLALTFGAFTVKIDATGFTARGAIGWPKWHIPLRDIASVRVPRIAPLAEFGGWGVRHSADGRFGIVVRTGDAIEVRRTNGKAFVVTIDDAARGAAVLQALLERESPRDA